MSLELIITDAITELKDAGLQLHFVFNGLDYSLHGDSDPFVHSATINKSNANAFDQYEKSEGGDVSGAFKIGGLANATYSSHARS